MTKLDKVKLGDLTEIARGSSPRPITNQAYFVGGSIPWVKIADATASVKYIYQTKQYVNDYGASFSRKLPSGSLIVSASGVSLGFAIFLGVEGCVHDGWIYFKYIDESKLNKDYLYFLLNTFTRSFHAVSYGAAIQNINTGILRETEVPLPELNAQKKIAAVLSAYDDLIENNKRRIVLLEKMAEEIYREWFVRFRFPGYKTAEFEKGIPKDWGYEKLDHLCIVIKRGISPKYDDESLRVVINQKCIRNGRIDLSLARLHDTKTPKEKYIKFSDALINSTGVGTLGRVSVVEFEPEKITCDSHVTICRANSEKINPQYLAVTVTQLQQYFEFMASGSTGQVELNRSLISGIKIRVPNREIQDKYSERVIDIWCQKQNLLQANENLNKTKEMLLPRLISGKLSVADLDIQLPPSMMDEVTSTEKSVA